MFSSFAKLLPQVFCLRPARRVSSGFQGRTSGPGLSRLFWGSWGGVLQLQDMRNDHKNCILVSALCVFDRSRRRFLETDYWP